MRCFEIRRVFSVKNLRRHSVFPGLGSSSKDIIFPVDPRVLGHHQLAVREYRFRDPYFGAPQNHLVTQARPELCPLDRQRLETPVQSRASCKSISWSMRLVKSSARQPEPDRTTRYERHLCPAILDQHAGYYCVQGTFIRRNTV